MLDPRKLINDLLGSTIPGTQGTLRDKASQATQLAKDNPLAAGALMTVLLGTKTGRQFGGSALKLGGMAAIAGLAYKAWQNYSSGSSSAGSPAAKADQELLPPPAEADFHPAQAPQGETEFALTLLRVMIAAANADGHIDDSEREKIMERASAAGLDTEVQAFLSDEIANPMPIDAIVAAARTEAQKIELYTATRLTIEPKSRAERGYLDLLAGKLRLSDALIDHIEATISAAKE